MRQRQMNILINPPKEIFVTKEEFDNFTYYDMACFWCNWKVAFCYEDDMLVMYTGKRNICDLCARNHRFKDIQWYDIPRVEMYVCRIPKSNDLCVIIEKHLGYLIMR